MVEKLLQSILALGLQSRHDRRQLMNIVRAVGGVELWAVQEQSDNIVVVLGGGQV